MVANGVAQADGSTVPVRGNVTVRHLLTHTAGLACVIWPSVLDCHAE